MHLLKSRNKDNPTPQFPPGNYYPSVTPSVFQLLITNPQKTVFSPPYSPTLKKQQQ